LIGARVTRVDAPAKVSGQAKYTYDVHRPGMLYGKVFRSPYAHAKVVSIDTSAAEKMPGIKAIHIVQGPGSTIHWAGDDIVAVAAVDEPTAEDAVRAIKVKFQQLPHLVSDAEPPKGSAQEEGPLSIDAIDDMLDNQVPANQMVSTIQRDGLIKKASEDDLNMLKADGATDAVLEAIRSATLHPEVSAKPPSNYQKAAAQTVGDPDKAFAEADAVSEGCTAFRSSRIAASKVTDRFPSGPTMSIFSLTSPRRIFPVFPARWPSRSRFPPPTFACTKTTSAEDSQQVLPGSLGNFYRRSFQEGWRQAGPNHARA